MDEKTFVIVLKNVRKLLPGYINKSINNATLLSLLFDPMIDLADAIELCKKANIEPRGKE